MAMHKKEKKRVVLKPASLIDRLRGVNKGKQDRIQAKLKGKETFYCGDPQLQWVMGGMALGKVNLTYGPSGSGKTAINLKWAGDVQQKVGGYVVVFDSEFAYNDPAETKFESDEYTEGALRWQKRFTMAGLDWTKVIVVQGNRVGTLFKDLGEMEATLQENPDMFCCFLIDSWGGIQSERQAKKIDEGLANEAGNHFGGNAKTVGAMIQTIVRCAAEHAVTVLAVQHCIVDQKSGYWVLVGGNKLRYLSHNILFIESAMGADAHLIEGEGGEESRSKDHKDAATGRVGKKIYCRGEKSRFTIEGKRGCYYMNFNTLEFATKEQSLVDLAKNLGLIEVKGSWLSYPIGAVAPKKAQGGVAFSKLVKENKKLADDIWKDCQEATGTDAAAEWDTIEVEELTEKDVI